MHSTKIKEVVFSHLRDIVSKIDVAGSNENLSENNYFTDLGLNSIDLVELLYSVNTDLRKPDLPAHILNSNTVGEFILAIEKAI
ncbi:phosphopantetheine-binding protein [Microbulbifer sp. ZKSA006]|uniref:phosphopantetheine-binding protein n=1 Tax=Microbulbifer sp. ZKSA006 TaxID=3243390 RepID=UPI00403A0D27